MAYQERFETKLLQPFAHPENSEWFSRNFWYYFWVNIISETNPSI